MQEIFLLIIQIVYYICGMKRNTSSIFFLCLATFIMLAIAVLPHHHHDNGMLCLQAFATETVPADTPNCHKVPCDDNCIAKFKQAERTHICHVSCIHIQPVQTVFNLSEIPTGPIETNITDFLNCSVYIEQLHGILLSHSSGLRAPPHSIG